MSVRTTVEIPDLLHDTLRHRSERSGVSIRALIVRALDQTYGKSQKGELIKGPLITGPGKLGPAFPDDENPHDLVFP